MAKIAIGNSLGSKGFIQHNIPMVTYFRTASQYRAGQKTDPKLLVAGSFWQGGNAGDMAAMIALQQFLEHHDFRMGVEFLSSSSPQFANFEYMFNLSALNQELVNYLRANTNLLLMIGGGTFFGPKTAFKVNPLLNGSALNTALFCIGAEYAGDSTLTASERQTVNLLARTAAHISTRTPYDQAVCRGLGLSPTETNPLGDIVNLLHPMPGFYNILKPGDFNVGVNLSQNWPDIHFVNFMSEALDGIIRHKQETRLIFLPFGYLSGKDWEIHDAVIAGMKRKDRVLAIKDFIYPTHLQDTIAKLDLMIGMRLHACVMAYNAGVPFTAIAYHPKIQGFLDQVGLRSNIIVKGLQREKSATDYGYSPPMVYPALDETLAVILKSLSAQPLLDAGRQRRRIGDKLNALLRRFFPSG